MGDEISDDCAHIASAPAAQFAGAAAAVLQGIVGFSSQARGPEPGPVDGFGLGFEGLGFRVSTARHFTPRAISGFGAKP